MKKNDIDTRISTALARVNARLAALSTERAALTAQAELLASLLAIPSTTKTKAKASKRMSRPASPERRAELSAIAKAAWANRTPEQRAEIARKMKEGHERRRRERA